MNTILKRSADWYNPLFIDNKEFKLINIVDGDKVLYSFNWFCSTARCTSSTNEEIHLASKLVRSTLNKNLLRYSGNKDNYTLSIDKSLLLCIATISESVLNGSYNDTIIRTYQIGGLDVYFDIYTQLAPNAKQQAYQQLHKLTDSTRSSLYEIQEAVKFYKANLELFKKAGLE